VSVAEVPLTGKLACRVVGRMMMFIRIEQAQEEKWAT
jgi:hypothetical protein